MTNPTILLLLTALAAPGDGVPPAWQGDVSRALLASLPGPQALDGDGAALLAGSFTKADWERFTTQAATDPMAATTWAEAEAEATSSWPPEIDWENQGIVFVAFDGATRILGKESWAEGTLTLSQQFTRRPDRPDGPCSLVLQVVDRSLGEVKLRFSPQTELGKISLP